MIPEVSVSILGLDWSDRSMIEQALLRASNANSVHFDMLDGKFVKEKSFGTEFVESVQTSLPKDAHLMVKQPEKYIDALAKAGVKLVFFHVEATRSPKKLIEKIKEKNMRAGIAVDPETPVKKIERYLDSVDAVLVMLIHPGASGRKMISSTLKKVKDIKKKRPSLIVSVDGGINDKTASKAISAGADVLVSCSYVFKSKDPKHAIDILRNS
jgi:ribulose-phosphate 3-epimerase